MPTIDELKDALEHIKYEVDMINGLSAKLGSGALGNDDVLKNACLESMAIHLRSLESFLQMGQANKSDDVYARLYATSYVAPPKDATNDLAREYANKCVAHQTTKRAHNMPFRWQAWLSEIKVAYDIWRNSISFGSSGKFNTDPGELNPPPASVAISGGPLNIGASAMVSTGSVTST